VLLSAFEFIGRFHPVFVHLPIGVLLLALLLQWISFRPGYTIPAPVMKMIWWIGIIGALISCITGYLLSLNGEYEKGLVNIHMWLGIAVASISLLVASKIFLKDYGLVYKAGTILLFLLIIFTGHFGGSLTHGSDFLTAGWSDSEETAKEAEVRTITNVQEAGAYADIIEPMFSSKCYSCHGPKKQKGKLRLDKPELIRKGGKNGEIVMSGDPKHSELMKRLLLPRQEEEHMPPKQKPQLKESQVELISWWIEQGCSFDKKVKELEQPDKIKTLLTSLENKTGAEKQAIKLQPDEPVEAADEKAVSNLREKGVIVMPVAMGSNYLSANFVNASSFGDADAKLLAPLKKQLVSVKAGNTRIGDDGLKLLAACKNLISLQLNNTAITDKGLVYLKSLENLQSINLVNTNVSVQGVAALENIKKLEHIYVYKTKVNGQDYNQLKRIFPKTVIDTGGYSLPTIPSDTVHLTKPKTTLAP
jgi:mono/diheme cytochrome c family protein